MQPGAGDRVRIRRTRDANIRRAIIRKDTGVRTEDIVKAVVLNHTTLRTRAGDAHGIRYTPAKIDQTILGRSAGVRTNDEIAAVVYHRTAFNPGTCRTNRIVNAYTLVIDARSAGAIIRTEDTLTAIIEGRPAGQPGTGG